MTTSIVNLYILLKYSSMPEQTQEQEPQAQEVRPKNGPKIRVPRRAKRTLGGESFADLAFAPKSVKFQHQNEDEHMLMLLREHIAIFWWSGFMTLLGLGVPFLVLALQKYLQSKDLMPFTLDMKWWWACILIWYLFLASSLFRKFVDWFYNVNIMSNQRFIDLDFHTFTGHQVKETPLLKIQDASDTHVGPWHMVFDMGDLTIFTASEKTTFNLHNVPASSQVRDFIMDTVIAYSDQFKAEDIINAP